MKIPSGTLLWPQGELKQFYRKYNRKYFSNKLTDRVEVCWSTLGGNHYGRTQELVDGFLLLLYDPASTEEKAMHMTLLHEMAHIATWSERRSHGPKWKAEMRRLAKIGAFDRWW